MPTARSARPSARPLTTTETEAAEGASADPGPIAGKSTAKAKSLEQLATELKRGECRLVEHPHGQLVRQVEVVQVLLWIRRDGERLYLREDRQELANGEIRRRNLDASLAEKMVTGEDPLDAAKRALAEELGVACDFGLGAPKLSSTAATSPSYPGLQSLYRLHRFEAELPAWHVRSHYVEVQSDKTNYWTWTAERPRKRTELAAQAV